MDQQIIFQRLNALLASGRMSEMRGALLMLNPVDIAQYLSSLETENLLRVFRILPGDCSADVFSYMDDEQREKARFLPSAIRKPVSWWRTCSWTTRWTSSRKCRRSWCGACFPT